MNIRPLCKELQEKAEKELNEVPSQVESNLEHIKNWLAKQKHIIYKNDDQLLVNFLRCSKYSLERTKQKLDAYYTFRTVAPEIARNMDPLLPEVQVILKVGVCARLPISKDSPGDARVYLVRHENFDSDAISIIGMLKVAAISVNIDVNEDDNYVISGAKAVWDLKGFPVGLSAQVTPTLLMKTIHLLQTCYPSRIKALHVINIPRYLEVPLGVLKRLASEKFASRVHFHTTNNFEEIYKDIPKSVLPNEYGGNAGPVKNLMADWKILFESHRDRLLDEDNYYTDESKREGQAMSTESLFGIDGSFRKLEVD